jgi:hypothetical protein
VGVIADGEFVKPLERPAVGLVDVALAVSNLRLDAGSAVP